jgi:hypothetical protein
MNRNVWKFAVIVVLATFTITLYGQQQSGPPQGGGFKNLKVFPKDVTRQQLMGAMQNWTRALGVTCNHCHVDDTRAMMKMMQNLRANANDFLPDNRVAKVSCWTCHRGNAKIELPAPPTPPQGQGAAPAPKPPQE